MRSMGNLPLRTLTVATAWLSVWLSVLPVALDALFVQAKVSPAGGREAVLVFEFNTVYDVAEQLPAFCEEHGIDALHCQALREDARKVLQGEPIRLTAHIQRNSGEIVEPVFIAKKSEDILLKISHFCMKHTIDADACTYLETLIIRMYTDTYGLQPIKHHEGLKVDKLFTHVYDTCYWESAAEGGFGGRCSGTGSTPVATAQLREYLFDRIQQLNVRSLLDAPCGAMAWMPLLLEKIDKEIDITGNKRAAQAYDDDDHDDGDVRFQYKGIDVVPGVIANNTKEFADHPNWRFEALDMISQSLTEAFDLVVAKEVLQHLTDPQVKCVLNNIKRSGSKYLLATSLDREEGTNVRYDHYTVYEDMLTGSTHASVPYRPLDLTKQPFSLPPPIEWVTYSSNPKYNRMCLWELRDLPFFIEHNGQPLVCAAQSSSDTPKSDDL